MNVEPKDPGGLWIDLTVCADDFGLGDGINEAVLKLARSRRISGIGVLVEGPAWKTWAPLLDIADVDVGLHLNFTESLGGPGPIFPLSAFEH